MVSIITFLEGCVLSASFIPSTIDLTISIEILWNGIALHVDLNCSLIFCSDVSIKPTCSSCPQMCNSMGCKKILSSALSNLLSACMSVILNPLQSCLCMTFSKAVIMVRSGPGVQC